MYQPLSKIALQDKHTYDDLLVQSENIFETKI
jgi:hypothetical protein